MTKRQYPLRLPEDLYEAVKRRADSESRSINFVIEEAVRLHLRAEPMSVQEARERVKEAEPPKKERGLKVVEKPAPVKQKGNDCKHPLRHRLHHPKGFRCSGCGEIVEEDG